MWIKTRRLQRGQSNGYKRAYGCVMQGEIPHLLAISEKMREQRLCRITHPSARYS